MIARRQTVSGSPIRAHRQDATGGGAASLGLAEFDPAAEVAGKLLGDGEAEPGPPTMLREEGQQGLSEDFGRNPRSPVDH
jgi:hypothetical protein